MKFLHIIILTLITLTQIQAQNFPNGYPFNLPWDDDTQQNYLPAFEKSEITQAVTAVGDKFYAGDQPIQFWGVNLTTGACFPSKSLAPNIAARMRKMGINLVRFHHMDNNWTNNIFDSNENTLNLDPDNLDKLFFLISELKKNNIYSNINLNVSREFKEGDGVMGADSLADFAKGVTLYDRQLIDLQKDFATQLLTTTNPYTGMTLSADPAVSMLEIDNENTLYGFWTDGFLFPFDEGGDIMQRHSSMLDSLWNVFLLDKYQNQSKLETAWNIGSGNPTPELLIDPDFEMQNNGSAWYMESHGTSEVNLEMVANPVQSGNFAAAVNIEQTSTEGWHIQFVQANQTIEKDTTYTVKFSARSDNATDIEFGILQNEAPYNWYTGATFTLTSGWQDYEYSFKASETNLGNAKIYFSFGTATGTLHFDDISFKKSYAVGLEIDENLDLKNIKRVKYTNRFNYSLERIADNAEFYIQSQKAYYDEMVDFLKIDLQVKAPITGSNALGGVYESYTAENLDYIDDHAYWSHPSFPGESWSETDWYIQNESMLEHDELGTIPHIMGGYQMSDKPYTISEYNHPFPSAYQIEMLPIIAGYSAFHGVDGIIFFEYNGGNPDDWDTDIVNNFFELHRNNSVMAQFPLYAFAYRNGLIEEDPNPILVDYKLDWLYEAHQNDGTGRWGKYFPYDENLALTHAIKTTGFNHTENDFPTQAEIGTVHTSATNEIIFDADRNSLTIQTDKFESIAGPLDQGSFGSAKMTINDANNYGLVSWLSLTDADLADAQKSILCVSSRIQNTNMVWDGNTTVNNNWGSSPTILQSNTMTISLDIDADYITVYPLSETGEASSGTDYNRVNGVFQVQIDQDEDESPWFGIQAHGVTSIDNPDLGTVAIYPNPVKDSFFIDGKESILGIQIFALTGQKVLGYESVVLGKQIDVSGLGAGLYIIEVVTLDGKEWYRLVVE